MKTHLAHLKVRSLLNKLILASLMCALLAVPATAREAGPEYEEFGRQMVKSLMSGDAETFSNAVDKVALLDRVFADMEETKGVRDLRGGMAMGLAQIGRVILVGVGQGKLSFVRTRHMEGENRALLRLDLGDQGLNYLDFILVKNESGVIHIVDWLDYARGRKYTESLAQAAAMVLPDQASMLEKLMGGGKLDDEARDLLIKLGKLGQEQNYAGWLEAYYGASEQLRNSRFLLVTRVFIASTMNDEDEYRKALADVHAQFGSDPTLALILVDHYFYEKDYAEAHRALDRLSRYTGGDAAIDAMKANISVMEGNHKDAIEHAETAIKKDEAYEDAYWTLLDSTVAAKRYKRAVQVLMALEKDFGYDINPDELATIDGYADFAKTDEFAKWKEGR